MDSGLTSVPRASRDIVASEFHADLIGRADGNGSTGFIGFGIQAPAGLDGQLGRRFLHFRR
jgi:hypothetical protein